MIVEVWTHDVMAWKSGTETVFGCTCDDFYVTMKEVAGVRELMLRISEHMRWPIEAVPRGHSDNG